MSKETTASAIKKPYISADIFLNVYNITVKVILTESIQFTFNELVKEDNSIVEFDCRDAKAVYVPSNKQPNKIYLLIDKDSVNTDTIYHETFHIVCRCMEIRDIIFDNENHEAFAYVAGYIGSEIHRFLSRNKIKIEE